MGKEIKNNIRLGIVVVMGIVLFTAAVYYIGARKNMFGEQFHISTMLNNANGLQVGNNVRYAGIMVGSVEDIVFVNDSTLRVDMVLGKQVKKFIRKDAVASVGMDGLVGNVIVNISPGSGNSPLAKDGEIIASSSRNSSSKMIETIGSTNENVALLSLKLLEISQKLNEGQGTIPMLIRDSLMAANFAITLQNLRSTTEQLLLTTRQLQFAADNISRGDGTIGYLLHDETLPHQWEMLTNRLDSLLIVQTQPIVIDLQKSAADLAISSAELKSVLQTLDDGDGLATTIIKDTIAAQDLQAILKNLNSGTARFNENMEALKHNFLFRRYFKKQEKEQEKSASAKSDETLFKH